MRYSYKLLVFFLLIALLPLVAVTKVTLDINEKAVRDSVSKAQLETAIRVADDIGGALRNVEDTLYITASMPPFRDMDAAKAGGYLNILLSEHEEFTRLALFDAEGRVVAVASITEPAEVAEVTALSHQDGWGTALKGETHFSDVHFSEPKKEPLIMVHVPVKQYQGKYVGVLDAEVNLRRVWEVVQEARVGGKGFTYVVDGAGRVIAHPDKKLVLQHRDLTAYRPVSRVLNGERGTLQYEEEGEGLLASYTPVKDLGWGVVVAQPLDEAFAAPLEMKNKATTLALVIIALVSIAAVFFSSTITRPIQHLKTGTGRIAKGELNHRIKVESRDEIGELADAFNEMASKLARSYTELERKVEERTREISRQKKLTERITHGIDEGIMLLSKDFRVLWANKKMRELTGLGEGEILDNYCYRITHHIDEPCKPPMDKCPVEEVTRTGGPATEVHVHTDKEGREFYVEVTAYPVMNEEGEISEFVHVARDVTGRRRMEQQLKEYSQELERKVEERTRELIQSEERHRTLFESTQDAVYQSNEDSVFTSMNQAGAEMFGFSSPSEIIGRSVLDFWVDPEDRKAFLRELEEKGSVKGYHIHAKKRNGKDTFLEASSRILRDGKGNFKGVEGILRDITERLRLEQALKEYSELLEERVEERTKELVEANKMKDLFTDIMRHDLLNPLGLIKNYAELVEDKVTGDEKADLGAIKRSADRLIKMIQNASTYEKLANVEELDFSRADLNAIFWEVIKDFEMALKEKGMTVDYLVKDERIAMVSLTIEDVFSNLLSNAIKYSPAGTKVVVDINDGDGSWLVVVKDHGPGIPDESKEKVFERFQRGGKKDVKGTGLGLAIVKRVVELHKGKVWVEDNPGGGSIFYVAIPKERR